MNVFKFEKHFVPRVVPNKETGCWEWAGAKFVNGYGRIAYKGKTRLVHRFSYEWHKGSIPDGLYLDHLCRNKICCNPDHLEAVTPQVNSLRGNTLAAVNASLTHCHRGHPLSGDNLYYAPSKRRVCRACSRAHSKKFRSTPEYRAYHAARERARRAAKK